MRNFANLLKGKDTLLIESIIKKSSKSDYWFIEHDLKCYHPLVIKTKEDDVTPHKELNGRLRIDSYDLKHRLEFDCEIIFSKWKWLFSDADATNTMQPYSILVDIPSKRIKLVDAQGNWKRVKISEDFRTNLQKAILKTVTY